jgi:hypothetical protein
MPILMRYEEGRNAYVNCSDATVGIRVFLFKPPFLSDLKDFYDDDNVVLNSVKNGLLQVILLIGNAIKEILTTDGQQLVFPSRICVYADPRDSFFSIYFGYRYSNKITQIGTLRFPIFEALFKSSYSAFLITGSDCHLANGIWDVEHALEAPIYTMDKNLIEAKFSGVEKVLKRPSRRANPSDDLIDKAPPADKTKKDLTEGGN